MVGQKLSMDRKEQIVSAAIERLFAVGFEGFRVGDVAKDVGINNATLIHHYSTKEALIKAVVERFTTKFQSVAEAVSVEGPPSEKLARHMRSSLELMQTSAEMFVVLNEIMIRSRRDSETSRLVSIPLRAWRQHIVSLILSPADESDAALRSEACEIATACMAQLLGMGLLLSPIDTVDAPFEPLPDQAKSRAIAALTSLVSEPHVEKG